jgi:hypothetical protein
MKQLQDLQTFVYARRPHAQDVVQLQVHTGYVYVAWEGLQRRGMLMMLIWMF